MEQEIRALITSGDQQQAATIAIRTYGPEIMGFLAKLEHNLDRAQEAFSMFCEDLWQGIAGFRGDSSFRTWAYTLARNASRRHHRDGFHKHCIPVANDSAFFDIADKVRTTTADHLRTDNKIAVRELRKKLTSQEQAILTLRVDRKMSWVDIAVIATDDDEGSVEKRAAQCRKRYQRTKEKLRALAKAEGIVQD